MTTEDEVIQRLIRWGEERAAVRAMLLTSTRAIPNAPLDDFSDYDVILVVTDIRRFYEDRAWLEDFGRVLVGFWDPIGLEYGFERSGNVIQYEDDLKIDFTLWPVEILRRIEEEPELPDELDAGYAILLDKDGLTNGLKAPTYQGYIPTPPTEEAYQLTIEEFFVDSAYVAKSLWRDELMPAKWVLECSMKQAYLRPMLEWLIEIEHDWSVKPGNLGKGLKKRLPPEIWSELEDTYVGGGVEENWEGLFRTIGLFRKVAIEVGEHLGYAYPNELDGRMMAHLQKVKGLGRLTL